MRNLIKAQLYQLRKEKLMFCLFVGVIGILLMNLWFEYADQGKSMTASYYIAANGYYLMSMSMIFILCFTGDICGADFVDKTINYEVLGGSSRKDVYRSRVLLCLVGGGISAVVLWTIPVGIAAIVGGWGNTLGLAESLGRLALALLPVLRLVCEFIALSYVFKNSYLVMALGCFASIASQAFMEQETHHLSVFLGFTNLAGLFDMEFFRTYTVADLREYVIYDAGLRMGEVCSTVAASVLFGGLALYLGKVYYQRDDLD